MAILAGIATQACAGAGPKAASCTDSLVVDDFKELMIVDAAAVGDARAQNATDGPWSFRHAVESMVPAGMDPGEFVRKWMVEQWAAPVSYNSYSLDPQVQDQQSRTQQMISRVLCPWFQKTSGNGCNADCSTCTANPPKLDLSAAPFRLSAIINRMDLREQPDIGNAGEARLEFGLTNGPGDDPASMQMPMSIIFEYRLPSSLSVHDWAKAWHSLGSHQAFDDSYKSELEALTARWVGPNASPSAQNGSAIGQVRTDESTLDWIWQLRQFVLGPDGQLHQTGVRNTPPEDLNGSQAVIDFMSANAAAILAEKFVVPSTLLGGAADALIYQWNFPGADPMVAQKFAVNTCNGCHTERPNVDSAFHISPFRTGTDKLSKFLYDPQDRTADELTRREADYRTALCTP
jgi:hypothetical protein